MCLLISVIAWNRWAFNSINGQSVLVYTLSKEPKFSSLVEQLDKLKRKNWLARIVLFFTVVLSSLLLEWLGHFGYWGFIIFNVAVGVPSTYIVDRKFDDEKEKLIKEAEQSASKRECSECGKEVHDDEFKFCPFCGTSLPNKKQI